MNPGDKDVWSVGDPNSPSPEDTTHDNEESAKIIARFASEQTGRVFAVWHGGACVALYYEGELYRRA